MGLAPKALLAGLISVAISVTIVGCLDFSIVPGTLRCDPKVSPPCPNDWVCVGAVGASLGVCQPSAGQTDGGDADHGVTDAGPSDFTAGERDAPTRDGSTPDGPTPDGPAPDGPAPDGSAPDGPAPDAPLPDGPAPDGLLGACAAPALEYPWKPNMVICSPKTDRATQCEAALYCGSGWHLCTASEYVANGGDTEGPPGGGTYWLASCAREFEVLTAPTDAICGGACAFLNGYTQPVTWTCSGGGSGSLSNARLGVVAKSSCHRVGINSAATRAYWDVFWTGGTEPGAICCQ